MGKLEANSGLLKTRNAKVHSKKSLDKFLNLSEILIWFLSNKLDKEKNVLGFQIKNDKCH